MKFFGWLFDRKRSCADCSLYERQAVCAQDAIVELSRRQAVVMDENDRLAAAEGERDGLVRELIMEGMRRREMSEDFRGKYGRLSCQYGALLRQVMPLKAVVGEERQRRIVAEAELAVCRRQLTEAVARVEILRSRAEHAEGEIAARKNPKSKVPSPKDGGESISCGGLSSPAQANTAESQAESPPGKYLPEGPSLLDGARGETLSAGEHAFTCKKCGGHAAMWNADIWSCSECGQVLQADRKTKAKANEECEEGRAES